MMRNGGLALFSLLTLASVSLLLLQPGGAALLVPGAQAAGAGSTLTPRTGEAGGGDGTGPARRKAESPLPAAPTGKGGAGEREVLPPCPGGWRVQVIDRQNRSPAAGARIFYASQARSPDPAGFALAFNRSRQNLEPFLEQRASLYAADDQGETRVPPPGPGLALVAARLGEKWAVRYLYGSASPPLRLELEPPRELAVQVVDGGGKALAGVPVAIYAGPAGKTTFRARGFTTGTEGTALIDTLCLDRFEEKCTFQARIDIPLLHPVQRTFRLDPFPRERITLTLREWGSLEVKVLDPAGEPYRGRAELGLTWYGGNHRPVHHRWRLRHRTRSLEEGRIHFPYVGLGLKLCLVGYQGYSCYPRLRADLDGPAAPGQAVVHPVRFGRTPPRLSLTALDREGKPFARTNLLWRLEVRGAGWGPRAVGQGILRSDDRGRIRHVLAAGTPWWYGEIEEKAFLLETMGLDGGERLSARVVSAGGFPAGENRVGRVVLRPAEIVVAGRVVDGRGRPVPGALVRVSRRVRFGPDHCWYRRVEGLHASADGEGHFLLEGEAPAGELVLQAEKTGCRASERRDFTPGERDIRLTLRTAGEVTGRVLLDPGIDPERLEAVIECYTGGGTWRKKCDLDKDGRFLWRAVPPGSARITIHAPTFNEELARLDPVRVPRREAARDPRLERIDLRGRIHPIRLDLRRSDGDPIGWAQVARGPGYGEPTYIRIKGNVIYALEPLIDLDIRAGGFRLRRCPGLSDGETVYLVEKIYQTIKLRFRWPPEFAPGEMEFCCNAELKLVEPDRGRDRPFLGDGDSDWSHGVVGDKSAKLVFGLSFPGTYRLTLELELEDDRGSFTRKVPSLSRCLFVADPPPTPGVVELELGPELIKKLWRRPPGGR